jgi:hypothetical protein
LTEDENYMFDPGDATIGEHSFRLQGDLWKEGAGVDKHEKVLIDRSIHPMVLTALSLYGTLFASEDSKPMLDEMLSKIGRYVVSVQVGTGRYCGMWHMRQPSIYYTHRVVQALVDLYEYVRTYNGKADVDLSGVALLEKGHPVIERTESTVEARIDILIERITDAVNRMPFPDEMVHKGQIRTHVKEEIEDAISKVLASVKSQVSIDLPLTVRSYVEQNFKDVAGNLRKELNLSDAAGAGKHAAKTGSGREGDDADEKPRALKEKRIENGLKEIGGPARE